MNCGSPLVSLLWIVRGNDELEEECRWEWRRNGGSPLVSLSWIVRGNDELEEE